MRFDPEVRRAARPALVYDEALPVNQRRAEIGAAIEKHQVVVSAARPARARPRSCRRSASKSAAACTA
jgi:HrpA-like RNA helicase